MATVLADPGWLHSPVHLSRVTVLVLVACSIGCEVRDEPRTSVAVDSAGIQIIESLAQQWGAASRMDPEPFIRVGSEAEGPYQFGDVSHARFMNDGAIAAADLSAMELRVFDAKGKHIRSFGRRGNGPGEFQLVSSLFECGVHKLAVLDQRLRRLTVQPVDGADPEIHDVPGTGNQTSFGCATDGTHLLYNPGQYRRELPQGLQWDSTDVVVWWPGDSARTIARLPVFERLIGPGGSRRSLEPAGVAVHAVATASFYWATSDRYEIRRFDLGGKVTQILRRPIQPSTVSDSLYDAYVAGFLEQVQRTEGEEAVPGYRRSLEDGGRGATMPLFGTAFVDHDARLWVSSNNWPTAEFIPESWSVFDDAGNLLADLAAPDRVRIVDARDDHVLGVAYDDLGVMSLQIHRLVVQQRVRSFGIRPTNQSWRQEEGAVVLRFSRHRPPS